MLASTLLIGCSGESENASDSGEAVDASAEFSKEYTVTSRELSDPESINLLTGQGESTTYLGYYIMPSLTGVDFKTLKVVPYLAKALPEVEEKEDGRIHITYEIREEAVWDNGEPVTAEDVAFGLKVIKNPRVDCERIRPYFEFIEDVKFYPENPKKFTIIGDEAYMLAEQTSGGIYMFPPYIYDPDGLMEKFTVKQLARNAEELRDDPDIKAFADLFNSEKFAREVVAGCGPYELDKWETNQRLVLKRKENWWGDQLKGLHSFFDYPRPEKIIFETINDDATAITALKSQKVDVMRSIDPKVFVKDLPKSEKYNKYFDSHTPNFMAYEYIGMHMKNPKFESVKTRKALAYLTDVQKMLKTIFYGLGERTVGFIHPSHDDFYNDTITPYEFNVDKAQKLLAEDGWKDTDGDGVLDKMINGTRTNFTIQLNYNNGNPRREKIALIFQEQARKVGINVDVRPLEWSVFLERTKKHEFEMYIGGWVSSILESDPKQIWHTDSYNDGSNYVGFGDAETDQMIEDLRSELDKEKRAKIYKQLQVVLHEEVPYIFLYITKQRIAIHKRFENAYGTPQRPGYWRGGFRLASEVTQ
ncbi:MAG: ABC transporter substrate-binding protein [Chitinophagales bacterium]